MPGPSIPPLREPSANPSATASAPPSMSDIFARRAEELINSRMRNGPTASRPSPSPSRPATSEPEASGPDASQPAARRPSAPNEPQRSVREMMAYPADYGSEAPPLKVQGWFEWLDEKATGLFNETWAGIGESWNGTGRADRLAAQDARHDHHHHASNDPEPPGATPPGAPRGRSGGRGAA